ncbi:DHH family phosphoesterase [Candidatus Woesearchaeota archaeon]|nr:DHH family phosphoesterase [Candidatus Woesearchaeota archaeon]
MRQILGRVDSFLKSISASDRIAIIHDADPDGICSAAILARFIKKARNRKPEFVSAFDKETYSISEQQIRKLRSKKINKLIVTDFSLDQHADLVKRLKKFADILVIDHHKLYRNINSKNVVLVKPQLFSKIDPSRYCSAKLAYDLCARISGMSDCDWLAAVASIADVATAPWRRFLDSVFRKYKIKKNKDYFRTDFGRIASMINSLIIIDSRKISKAFNVLYSAGSPKEVLRSDLIRYKTLVDRELGVWLKKFAKCEHYKDLYLFLVSPKYNIKSTISTVLGLKYPHRTILVMSKDNGSMSVSARRGDQRLAVNALLEKAIKGFSNANAGGHIPAAGGHFLSKDFPVFKKRVIELCAK